MDRQSATAIHQKIQVLGDTGGATSEGVNVTVCNGPSKWYIDDVAAASDDLALRASSA